MSGIVGCQVTCIFNFDSYCFIASQEDLVPSVDKYHAQQGPDVSLTDHPGALHHSSFLTMFALTTWGLSPGFIRPYTGKPLQTWIQSCNQDRHVHSKGYSGSITFHDIMSNAGRTTLCLLENQFLLSLQLLEPNSVETLTWVGCFGRNRSESALHLPMIAAVLAGARVLGCETAIVC